MKHLVAIGAFMLTTALTASVRAQGQPGGILPTQVGPGPSMSVPSTAGFDIGMLVVEPLDMSEAVENAPYSAEIVNEVLQQLPDDNRIERRTTGTVARDSRGRVRREQPLTTVGPVVPRSDVRMITISDPVTRVHYSLDPMQKMAMRSRPPQARISNARRADGKGPGVPADAAPLEVSTESLGEKEFEGIRADGTKITARLPAGAVGNLRPIEVVSERWYSPELRVVVFARRADPRYGETIYRLRSIMRLEPESSLFQVPDDYKVEDIKPLR